MQTRFFLFGVAAALLATPLGAAEVCELSDIEGRYAVYSQLWDLRASPPSPATISGTFYANGTGAITEWRDVLTTSVLAEQRSRTVPRDVIAAASAAGFPVLYEVDSDCRFRIQTQVLTPRQGVQPVRLEGAIASGGRELFITQVDSFFVSTAVAKSVEDPAARGAARAADIKELLDRVAVRNGLRP